MDHGNASSSLTGECAVAQLFSHLVKHYPAVKRFSSEEAITILHDVCEFDRDAVQAYLTDKMMTTVSLRDLGTMARHIGGGMDSAVFDQSKICKQFLTHGFRPFGSRCLYYHRQPDARAKPPSYPRQMMAPLAAASNNFTAPVVAVAPVVPKGPPLHDTMAPFVKVGDAAKEQFASIVYRRAQASAPPPCLTFVIPALVDLHGNFIRYLTPAEVAPSPQPTQEEAL